MNDITMHKWDCAIVDWVNCLEVSEHIQSISALKNGDFFKAFLSILQPDLQTSLKEFLQTHYPSFELPNNECNYSDAELSAAASLLLHYMCMYDRRDSLIAPLCKKLSASVQTYIKYFLEHFTLSTQYNDFEEVVRKSVDCESPVIKPPEAANPTHTPKGSLEWNSSGESPFLCNSPLHEYFKTPAAKTAKMQEKDREIRRLKQELQAERFEKEDMNLEMKEHKEKIKKISKEVHEKSLTISSLTARLSELEENTPIEKPREMIEIEKLLRNELTDCQTYISQLQAEHGDLLERNEEINKKLEKSTENASMWQEKSTSFESKYEELASKHQAQEFELNNLRINYNELSALLDELRQNKPNTSAYEMDVSTFPPNSPTEAKSSSEDLAATVVEIQLKECQQEMQALQASLRNQIEQTDIVDKQLQDTVKELDTYRSTCQELQKLKISMEERLDEYKINQEKLDARLEELTMDYGKMERDNNELRQTLQVSVEKSQMLEDELVETKAQLEDANNNRSKLQTVNEEMQEQIFQLQNESKTLQQTNEEILKKIDELSSQSQVKDDELKSLRQSLHERQEMLESNEELVASLTKDLEILKESRSELDNQLKIASNRYETLHEESQQWQKSYEEAVENFTVTNFNLEAIQKQLKDTDNKMQMSIDKLEEMLQGSIENAEGEKVERLACLVEKLSEKQMSFENTIATCNQVNSALEEQVAYLQQADVTNKENLERLQKTLNTAEDTIKELEATIQERVAKIDELNATVAEMHETTRALEEAKLKVHEKNDELLSEMEKRATMNAQQTASLQESITTWETKHSELLKVIEKHELEAGVLHNDKKELLAKLSDLEEDNKEKDSEITSQAATVDELDKQNEALEEQLVRLHKDMERQKYQSKELTRKLEDASQEQIRQLANNRDLHTALDKSLREKKLFQRAIQECQSSLEEQRSQNNELLLKYEQSLQNYAEKSHDNNVLGTKLETLREANERMQNELSQMGTNLANETKKNEELVLKVELAEKQSAMHEENSKQLNATVKSLEDSQSELRKELEHCQKEFESQRDELDRRLNLTSKESEQRLQENSKLISVKSELESQVSLLSSELESVKSDNVDQKRTISELMTEIDLQLRKLHEKNSEMALCKEEFANKDLEHVQMINKLHTQIDELENTKEKLVTDLNVVKGTCELKQQEINELQKSSSQLDKKFQKHVSQHDKKMDLMKLTIDNLEKNVVTLESEKKSLEAKLQLETQAVAKLTEEKGTLSGKCGTLRQEIQTLRDSLEQKEAECMDKDEVFEKTNQELLLIKLELESKASALCDAQNMIFVVEAAKNTALETITTLNDKLSLMERQQKSSELELKTITELKNSMEEKMSQLEKNMKIVCEHFGIKEYNMKKAVKDLKHYKDSKEKEICELNRTLNNLRESLNDAKDKTNSVENELHKTIKQKNDEILKMEAVIESYKVAEVGLLQEIASLREELNYTKDKYTAALQSEKEQKAESDEEIRSLTENVHDLLTKFNNLEKEYKMLNDELAYNKKANAELVGEKEMLELEIVRLKAEYDEDMQNCRDEFKTQYATLQKIEQNLNNEVAQLKSALETSNEDSSSLRVELHDAKEQLHIIETEKDALAIKIDQMDMAHQELQRNYAAMGIKNEALLKESKAELLNTQDKLNDAIRNHGSAIEQKEREIGKLKREIDKLNDRLENQETAYKNDTEQRQEEIVALKSSIDNFTKNIEKLSSEKENLLAKLSHHKDVYAVMLEKTNEKDEKLDTMESTLKKLQISYEILEAGKGKMETLNGELEERQRELEITEEAKREEHAAQTLHMQAQIDKLTKQLQQAQLVIAQKSAEIDAANEEFDSVQLILTNMTKQMEASSRELTTIHEDYEGKLKSERKSLRELQEQYATTVTEMKYVASLNDELYKELEEAKSECAATARAMQEKEALISELHQKYDQVARQVVAKDATIASLQTELAARLDQLAHAAGQRQQLEDEHRHLREELQAVTRHREELIEKHAEHVRAGEANLLRVHEEMQQLVTRMGEVDGERLQRDDLERMLHAEREAKRFVEVRVAELEAQVHEAADIRRKLSDNIRRFASLVHEKDDVSDEEDLGDLIQTTEKRIVEIFAKQRELLAIQAASQKDKEHVEHTLTELDKCNKELSDEKAKLIENYERLHEEKISLVQQKAKDSKSYENLKTQYELLKDKQHSSQQLEEKVAFLEQNNKQRYESYRKFLQQTQHVFKELEGMVTRRNQVEHVVYSLKELYTTLQIKATHVTEATHRLHYEQKTALEIIIDDIQKQFRRSSNMIYNLNLKCHQIVERTVNGIIADDAIEWGTIYKELNGEELSIKLEDLKDNADNALEQLQTFLAAIEQLSAHEDKSKVLKENNPQLSKPKEDEWKKKYFNVKQKLTLVENAKNNFEKKIRQLREENKKLNSGDKVVQQQQPTASESKSKPPEDTDAHYKKLLQDYIQLKGQYESDQGQWENRVKVLLEEQQKFKEQGQGDFCVDELRKELDTIRSSYRDLKITYSQLELEHSVVNKLLEERNEQLRAQSTTQEAYATLCEENTRFKTEIDTLKYKRNRDREEYLRLLSEGDSDINKKMQAVKAEYDLKLEKMKVKIISKYKEQIEQNESEKREKLLSLKEENTHYKETIGRLEAELSRTSAKMDVLDTERQYALQQLKLQRDDFDFKEPMCRRASTQSLHNEGTRSNTCMEERRFSTLPRNGQTMDIIEEVRYRRRTSITPAATGASNMEMEDEGEMFNNKYLHELKDGRYNQPAILGRESASSRLSEMAFRNSLVPAHLKSSYPLETQFLDPSVKDDDIRSGNIYFDDNMKTQLLPVDRTKKKESGTTSYKKPGPPTPSKHGGRLSLQGNQREVLREVTEQKRTPNPLRSLFSRSKDSSATAEKSSSPRKRTSIFRR